MKGKTEREKEGRDSGSSRRERERGGGDGGSDV